ncbi:hypothetical protein FNV43_RR16465 [Rhamnella rubrinervis]|uniref:Uncharacterized protein n=1 Tax=Rhamnella rubrinervis TaxID=2594499 RepID=A0A8K0MC11_9ROSA|nr:hypothetical protein FNV43_RR16465 [Rhamnella rubrinervis]
MAEAHIAMFPWFAMGHIISYHQLTTELAARGLKISMLLPKKTVLKLLQYPNLISHPLTVPDVDGLPPGAEIASDVPFPDHHLLVMATDPKQLGFKSATYHSVAAATLAFVMVPSSFVPKGRPLTEDECREIPHGYPSSTVVHRGDYEHRVMAGLSQASGEGTTFYERATTAMKNCDAICIRTCREIEGKYCDYIAAQYRKPVLLTGPALPEKTSPLEDQWDKWLGGFGADSVVFCAFGSQYILEKDQFQELVVGFEMTGLPFFIALKPPTDCTTVEEASPAGFEERVKGRGVVHGGWVRQQQILILSHPSVGLLVEELKAAVEVDKDQNGWFSKESLSEAIKCVMDKDGAVGLMVKKNHSELKQVLGKPGWMSGYIDQFVHNLHELGLVSTP